MREMPIAEVAEQLRALGVEEGDVVVVHTAFRKVRPVEGGPLGLIAALRLVVGARGTIVMPTMTDGESVYDPRATPSVDMGVVAETFWRQPGVVRSDHPGGSFAAEGPHAEAICATQPLSPPHGHDSPVGRVFDLDGQVLLLGVGHGENTTMHLAEAMAEVTYSVVYPTVAVVGGVVQTVDIAETDHCCQGFAKMDAWLRAKGLQREGRVGHAEARLVKSRDVVAVAGERLAEDALVFLCRPEVGCEECDRARASC